MLNLKDFLMNTKWFIDNEYLDLYISLIDSNRLTRKVKFETQLHHILPRFYFKLLGLPIDNSMYNCVYLSNYDHCLAHYYLGLCTKGLFKQRATTAFLWMTDSNKTSAADHDKLKTLSNYEDLIVKGAESRACAAKQSGKRNFGGKYLYKADKVKHLRSDTDVQAYLEAGWQLGNPKAKQCGTIWITNGFENKVILPEELEFYQKLNYNKGRNFLPRLGKKASQEERKKHHLAMLNKNKGTVHINNGKISKMVKEADLVNYLSQGWIRGRLKFKKQKIKETD